MLAVLRHHRRRQNTLKVTCASTESPPERTGRRRSMPGSPADKATPAMEATTAAATPFRVTVSTVSSLSSLMFGE